MNGFPQAFSVGDTIKSHEDLPREILASALPSVRKAVWTWMERVGLPTTIELEDACNLLSRKAVRIVATMMTEELRQAGFACVVANHTALEIDRITVPK